MIKILKSTVRSDLLNQKFIIVGFTFNHQEIFVNLISSLKLAECADGKVSF